MQEVKELSVQELRLVQGGNVLGDLWNWWLNKMVKALTWPASCEDDPDTEEDCQFFGPEAA